jgi:hypothetical protein
VQIVRSFVLKMFGLNSPSRSKVIAHLIFTIFIRDPIERLSFRALYAVDEKLVLVVRVTSYRSRDPGFDSRRYEK